MQFSTRLQNDIVQNKIDVDALTSIQAPLEHLQEMLQTAILIELSTLPPYLTAMFSIKDGTNKEAVSAIRAVVMEEMLHFALAGNVLTALGGKISFDAQNIPKYPANLPHSDDSFIVDLQAFSVSCLETFMRIELPASPRAKPQANRYHTIGQFYTAIEVLLIHVVDKYGESRVFSGNPTHQLPAISYYGGGGELIQVKCEKTALEALEVIVDQGEGNKETIWAGNQAHFGQTPQPAHYFQFKQLIYGRRYKQGDTPSIPPSGEKINVDFDAVWPIKINAKSKDYIAFPSLAKLNNACNSMYTKILKAMELSLSTGEDHISDAIPLMYQLKYLARQLMANPFPAQSEGTGELHATPTFEWYEDHEDHRMTEYSQGKSAPTIPDGMGTPFFYNSLENCGVYYLVPKDRAIPLFASLNGLTPAIFGDKHCMVSFNFQRYYSSLSSVYNVTQELEINVLCFPTSRANELQRVTPESYLLGDDQAKEFGNIRLFVPCDNAIAIKAGKELYGEPKILCSFDVEIPDFNSPTQHTWKFTTLTPVEVAEDNSAAEPIFTCTVNVEDMTAREGNLSPITEYGIRNGELIAMRWNLFQVMPTFFLNNCEAAERINVTFGTSPYENIAPTLSALIDGVSPFAVRLFQSVPVATANPPYYP